MSKPRYLELDGKRYLWRDIATARKNQPAEPAQAQPALFVLREDHRPQSERAAASRYQAPSLFSLLEG